MPFFILMDEIREITNAVRDTCRFYLKIDFGFLAGIISIITILKLGPTELLVAMVDTRFFIVGMVILIIYGLIFDYWLLVKSLAKNSSEKQTKLVIRRTGQGIWIQLVLHILLISYISSFALGYSRGYVDNCNAKKATAPVAVGIN